MFVTVASWCQRLNSHVWLRDQNDTYSCSSQSLSEETNARVHEWIFHLERWNSTLVNDKHHFTVSSHQSVINLMARLIHRSFLVMRAYETLHVFTTAECRQMRTVCVYTWQVIISHQMAVSCMSSANWCSQKLASFPTEITVMATANRNTGFIHYLHYHLDFDPTRSIYYTSISCREMESHVIQLAIYPFYLWLHIYGISACTMRRRLRSVNMCKNQRLRDSWNRQRIDRLYPSYSDTRYWLYFDRRR